MIKYFLSNIYYGLLCDTVINFYGGFWAYRDKLIKEGREKNGFYNTYLENNCASIGLKSKFATHPILPHGLHGIHISDGAIIGKDVVILQNVTIGSNTLKNTKHNGAPIIGDNCFIGANSSIVGGITIGNNVRIGSNCCVFKNVENSVTVVSLGMREIKHKSIKDNAFNFYSQESI